MSRLRFEPGLFCARVQHANHSRLPSHPSHKCRPYTHRADPRSERKSTPLSTGIAIRLVHRVRGTINRPTPYSLDVFFSVESIRPEPVLKSCRNRPTNCSSMSCAASAADPAEFPQNPFAPGIPATNGGNSGRRESAPESAAAVQKKSTAAARRASRKHYKPRGGYTRPHAHTLSR